MKQVNSTDFQRNFAVYQDVALVEPLAITKHERPRLVVMSYEEYKLMRQGMRRAMHVTALSDADLDAIASAKMPDGLSHLDDELDS